MYIQFINDVTNAVINFKQLKRKSKAKNEKLKKMHFNINIVFS